MKSVLLFLMFGAAAPALAAEPAGGHGCHAMELGRVVGFLQQYWRDCWTCCDMPSSSTRRSASW